MMENSQNKNRGTGKNGRIWAGLLLLGVGVALLLDKMGYYLPVWVFTWPMVLIVISLIITLKHNFRAGPWFIGLFIGVVFLIDSVAPEYSLRRFIWPVVIIGVGLFMIFRPKPRRGWGREWRSRFNEFNPSGQQPFIPPFEHSTSKTEFKSEGTDDGEILDSTAVFGGVRKVILSKNFKGGEATSVFGGHEIDLSRSDINGTVELELTQVFGGTKLIVPKHWNIKSEVVAFLGGVEDKRVSDPSMIDYSKTLLLKGTSVLGGLDIRNY